jgi:hypothetical protein
MVNMNFVEKSKIQALVRLSKAAKTFRENPYGCLIQQVIAISESRFGNILDKCLHQKVTNYAIKLLTHHDVLIKSSILSFLIFLW